MRWPWVSRAAHETVVQVLTGERDMWERVAKDYQQRHTALVDKYAARGDPVVPVPQTDVPRSTMDNNASLSEVQFGAFTQARLLSLLSRSGDAFVAEDASIESRAGAERQRAQLCRGLQAAGIAEGEAMRILQQSEDADASRRLLATLAGSLAVSALSSSVAPAFSVSREHSPITEAIRIHSDGDPRLARYFRKRAKEIQQEHPDMSAEGVAEMLGQWENATPSEASGT